MHASTNARTHTHTTRSKPYTTVKNSDNYANAIIISDLTLCVQKGNHQSNVPVQTDSRAVSTVTAIFLGVYSQPPKASLGVCRQG